MNIELLIRLREDLTNAAYRLDSIRTLLGDAAESARLRGVFTPARRALNVRPVEALSELVRLFLLGSALSRESVELALPKLGVEGATDLGLIAAHNEGFRAAVSLNPIELPDPTDPQLTMHWLLLSDLDDQLRRGPARAHHVMGVGGATRSLLAQAPVGTGAAQQRIRRALDLGTGCGIVALYLAAAGIRDIVASDISERALMFARANEILNATWTQRMGEGTITFVCGSLFSPLVGQQFDLIMSNPPFVITPRQDPAVPTYEYRDGGLIGDMLIASVIKQAPEYLSLGGTLLCLANWETPWGGDGLQRVSSWIETASTGSTTTGRYVAWVIERDRVDPAQYAETWIRDGGLRPGSDDFEALMESWLSDFAQRRITSIGLGSIRLQRQTPEMSPAHEGVNTAASAPSIRLDRASGAFAPTPGESIDRIFALGSICENMSHDDILATHWRRDRSLREIRAHTPGSDDPRSISLHIDAPIARVVTADTLLAAAVGACDGELSLGQISTALAQLLAVDADAVAEALIPEVRELVWLGMLTPSEH